MMMGVTSKDCLMDKIHQYILIVNNDDIDACLFFRLCLEGTVFRLAVHNILINALSILKLNHYEPS